MAQRGALLAPLGRSSKLRRGHLEGPEFRCRANIGRPSDRLEARVGTLSLEAAPGGLGSHRGPLSGGGLGTISGHSYTLEAIGALCHMMM
eukprot:916541-Pyramimonas_sp.AAC.1